MSIKRNVSSPCEMPAGRSFEAFCSERGTMDLAMTPDDVIPLHLADVTYPASHPLVGHTVVDWVDFPEARYDAVEGDREIVDGISVLATPGHTPGHQSVTVRAGDGLVLIVGQAAQDARSFATGEADASVQRLRALNADHIHFSHDRAVLRRR